MMRMRATKTTGIELELPSPTNGTATAGRARGPHNNWEMRPGGMLVQKRTESDQNRPPPPTIRVRVKYGSVCHELHISSQATFGELKKMLTGLTGLHHQDQKLLFKDKERDSNAFLDTVGVKDKSKIVLIEDPISQERRSIEMRKNAITEKAAKSISEISLEVDRLAGQVSALESVISSGSEVVESDLVKLLDSLMNQLLKLDAINADGDVKLQRKMQVQRVQKYVEKLDMLKIKNSAHNTNGNLGSAQQSPSVEPQSHSQFSYEEVATPPVEQQQGREWIGLSCVTMLQPQQPVQQSRHAASGAVVITTQWETFDSLPAVLPAQPSTSARTTVSTAGTSSVQPRFNWDLL